MRLSHHQIHSGNVTLFPTHSPPRFPHYKWPRVVLAQARVLAVEDADILPCNKLAAEKILGENISL